MPIKLCTRVPNVLTMLGASAVINGYLVDNGSPEFVLGAATGTTISGTGFLPTIQVGNSSLNNSVTGITRVFTARDLVPTVHGVEETMTSQMQMAIFPMSAAQEIQVHLLLLASLVLALISVI